MFAASIGAWEYVAESEALRGAIRFLLAALASVKPPTHAKPAPFVKEAQIRSERRFSPEIYQKILNYTELLV